jgi:MoaA/NifB/PqqE/SkfB family radical SAM enzyme
MFRFFSRTGGFPPPSYRDADDNQLRLPIESPPMNQIRPTRIRVEASSFCQLRCPSCPTATGAIDAAVGRGFLRFADFRALLDRNPSLEQVELSNYGEAFLNPELLEILAYAAEKGVAILLGNGANLNHARDDVLEGLVRYRVREMTCSIDGASPDTYRKYRVRGDFDAVIRNIERINHFKRLYGTDLPKLTWQFVVFGHNEHEISLARAMAERLGMGFHTKLSWDPEFSPIQDEELVRGQTGETATTRTEYETLHGRKYLQGICLQIWRDPQINWDGKVLGCCRNFWGDFGGNAFHDGLVESLNNEKIAYAREMLLGLQPARADIPCTTCDLFPSARKLLTEWRMQKAAGT